MTLLLSYLTNFLEPFLNPSMLTKIMVIVLSLVTKRDDMFIYYSLTSKNELCYLLIDLNLCLWL